MKESFTAGKVSRAIQRFKDYGSDLVGSSSDSFEDRLALLVSFCESDDVFSVIHSQLIEVKEANFDAWYESVKDTVGSMVGSGSLKFPTDIEVRLSLMYQLLINIKDNKIDIYDFSLKFFAVGSTKLSSLIRVFNDTITAPLVRELTYRLEDIGDELPENSKEMVPATSIQIIHSAHNVIQQSATGNNISQSANQSINTELDHLFELMARELKGIGDDSKRKDSLEILESAREQAKSDKPKTSVIMALLSSLPAVGKVAELSQKAIEYISSKVA